MNVRAGKPTKQAIATLAERVAIHVEKGELALAHRLVDEAQLADCVSGKRAEEEIYLSETSLPERLVNVLGERGVFTLADLMTRRPQWLSHVPGVGAAGLAEVYEMLGRRGMERG